MTKGEIIGKTFLGIFVGGIIKIVTQLLVTLLGYGLFWLLSKIPIISGIVNFLFSMRGNSPSGFVVVISLFLAYMLMSFVTTKVCGDIKPYSYSMLTIGIIVIAIHVIFFIVNIIHGDPVFTNVCSVLFGIICILRRENMFD